MNAAGQVAQLSSWQVVAVYAITLVCSTICVIIPFVIISRSEGLVATFTRSPIYLRGITVILIIWATSALALFGLLNTGASAIFGVVIGYVFGAVNVKPPEQSGGTRPPGGP